MILSTPAEGTNCWLMGIKMLLFYVSGGATMFSASAGESECIFLPILVGLISTMRWVGETVDLRRVFLRGS